jgi:hypothetical protein
MPWKLKTSSIDVEVKYKKAPNKLLSPPPIIHMRTEDGSVIEQVRIVADSRFVRKGKPVAAETQFTDPDTKQPVPSSEVIEILEHYKYKNLDEHGTEVEEEDILHFAEQPDGSGEQQVRPYTRANTLEISDENWVPSTVIEDFLIDGVYELFSDDKRVIQQLYEEAELRLKNDQIGIVTWSWGGFKSLYAFVVPVVREGKFVWLVKFTENQPELQHLQDIPATKIPIREVPTLKTLPPVQALVIEVRTKKKAAQ